MIKDERQNTVGGGMPSAPRSFTPKKQHTFSDFLDGITLSVAAILVIVITMMYLTDVNSQTNFSIKEFGFSAFVMYVFTVSFYFLLRSFSGRRGKRTKEYLQVCDEIEKNANQIIENGFARYTANYCRAWEEEELDNTRKKILCEVGISVKEYNEKYCKYSDTEILTYFPALSELQRKAIADARKIKSLHYDEKYLSISDSHGRRRAPSGGFTVTWQGRVKSAQILITSAISSLFSASIAFEIISDPSFATVVYCLVRIVLILGFGVGGMVGGYYMTAVKEVAEKKEKTSEQKKFLKWAAENYSTLLAEEKAAETAAPIKVLIDTDNALRTIAQANTSA